MSSTYKANQHGLHKKDYKYIIAIGISTGGPKALHMVMKAFNQKLLATYVIVQHMPKGFTKSLADRLNGLSEIQVKEAEEAESLTQGVAYIAPGGKQLKIINSEKPQIQLTDELAYKGHKPSVNIMYNSLATLKSSKKVIAVIMTGMGADGLEGIMALKKQGNTVVIAQDEESCVVYGMPRAVVNEGLADYIVPLDKIVETIERIMGE